MHKPFLFLAAVALVTGGLRAQETRPLAIDNARILTMEGRTIESGTLLVRDGVIEALGEDIEIPAGYRIVDAGGGTVMPGLVSAWSHAGLGNQRAPAPQPQRGRRGGGRGRRGAAPRRGGRASNQAATAVVRAVYAKQEIFGELLEAGVTTLALTPRGNGFPGTGAILDPSGKTLDELTANEEAFVVVSPAANSATKTVLREGFEAAQQVVEARNQPPAPPAEETAQDTGDAGTGDAGTGDAGTGDAGAGEEQQTEAQGEGRRGRGRRSAEPNPNHEALADLLEGKKRAFLAVGSANDLVHYLDAVGEISYPTAVVTGAPSAGGRVVFRGRGGGGGGGSLELVVDQIKELEAVLLMPPTLGTHPGTNAVVNPPANLSAQGLEVGFLVGENRAAVENLFFQMMELVRHGLPRDVALRGVTAVPAKALGIDAEVGTLSPGKSADLLLFSGDPLDPVSQLVSVWHRGRQYRGEDR